MSDQDESQLDYEALDPDAYRDRYRDVPRERYMEAHWRPAVEAAIGEYLRGRILDLGCGFGNYLPALARVGRPVGVDLSARWLRWARRNARGEELVRADARQLPFADRCFDGALSVGLMEYVPPAAVVGELARVVRPGGHVVVLAPNRNGVFRAAARAIHRLRGVPYPCNEPTRAELRQVFHHFGFRLVESVIDDGLLWLPDAVDRRIGAVAYPVVEAVFRPFGGNPWSNLMLFIVERLPSIDVDEADRFNLGR